MTENRNRWPATSIIQFGNDTYRIDLRTVERAYFRGIVAGRYDEGRSALAQAAGLSPSTVSRFTHGKSVSIRALLAILRELELTFDNVATPLRDEG